MTEGCWARDAHAVAGEVEHGLWRGGGDDQVREHSRDSGFVA